jgi:Coenzyme PQQ synthesis protein D (PqqD)
VKTTQLLPGSVLIPSSHCVVREQGDGRLFYNSRSDELHLVPPTGFVAYQLCDGLRTVGDIHHILSESMPVEEALLRDSVYAFLGKLVSRGILEVEKND